MITLVIVESPGKVKKLSSYLGSDYQVVASVGHIRDLGTGGKNNTGIDANYQETYVISESKTTVIKRLKDAAKNSQRILLATDPDREGEAIAWHIAEVLKIPYAQRTRIEFHSITEKAVKEALRQPRALDMNLVNAQKARRMTDRLVGFSTSPVVSSALSQNLSAGRVQTPALRLVVERELEIQNFKPVKFYTVTATVEHDLQPFKAKWLTKERCLNQTIAQRVAQTRQLTLIDHKAEEKSQTPPSVLTTSDMQAVASQQLDLSPEDTMKAAQGLYEKGAITYHRTDSRSLSEEGLALLNAYLQQHYPHLALEKPRIAKNVASAQAAHEGIRPTNFNLAEAGETAAEKQLYQLIRLRTLASQCQSAVFNVTTLIFTGDCHLEGEKTLFIAKGRQLLKKGYLEIYQEPEVEDQDNEKDQNLPLCVMNQQYACESEYKQETTKAPGRFSQAQLIKELEKRGIGRPATYATILSNIVSRNYVSEHKKKLIPSDIAFKVIELLKDKFDFVDLLYTKTMEEKLDQIAEGKIDHIQVVKALDQSLDQSLAQFKSVVVANTPPCPLCSQPTIKRQTKDGTRSFWACTAWRETGCKGAISIDAPVNAEQPQYPCPVCSAAMRRIKTKEGKYFWSCTAWKDTGCKGSAQDQKGKPVLHNTKLKQ